jgi:hypothetical protein
MNVSSISRDKAMAGAKIKTAIATLRALRSPDWEPGWKGSWELCEWHISNVAFVKRLVWVQWGKHDTRGHTAAWGYSMCKEIPGGVINMENWWEDGVGWEPHPEYQPLGDDVPNKYYRIEPGPRGVSSKWGTVVPQHDKRTAWISGTSYIQANGEPLNKYSREHLRKVEQRKREFEDIPLGWFAREYICTTRYGPGIYEDEVLPNAIYHAAIECEFEDNCLQQRRYWQMAQTYYKYVMHLELLQLMNYFPVPGRPSASEAWPRGQQHASTGASDNQGSI